MVRVSLVTVLFWTLAITVLAAPNPRTKIAIEAISQEEILDDAPCFIVYPEGEALQLLRESGTDKLIEERLSKRGYTVVGSEAEATVFVKVSFALLEPFETELDLKERATIDYSNAASTRNYAAMMQGGRYHILANPDQNRQRGAPETILGPAGELIEVGEQEPNAPKVVEGESHAMNFRVYPIAFEISAWQFPASQPQPENLWTVSAFYNNLKDEAVSPQLHDLAKASLRHVGKTLKSTKFVNRK